VKPRVQILVPPKKAPPPTNKKLTYTHKTQTKPKKTLKQKWLGHGPCGSAPALQVQVPDFNPHYCKTKKMLINQNVFSASSHQSNIK
jgi:hypothetical protein